MKYLLYIYTMLLAGTFCACSLDRFPEDKLLTDNLSSRDNEILLNGSYAQIKGWGDVMHRVREYPADNIVIRGSSTDAFYSFISYVPLANNGRLSTYWNNSFKVIVQTSSLIKKVVESPETNNSLGEAYYLRGLCYFYMCNTWGRPYYQNPEKNLGVPIVNGFDFETQDLSTLPDRATVKAVYEQAIVDMKKAATLMTEDKSRGKASKEAAWAMLSRIYLYMGGTFEAPDQQYNQLSIVYADSVIASKKYELLSQDNFKLYNTFNPDNGIQKETIFAIMNKDSDFPGSNDYYYGIGGMYANINGQGWGEMYASEKYLQLLKKSSREARNKGGVQDARGVFIKPQYVEKSDKSKIPAFRLVVPTYNKAVQDGFVYHQLAIKDPKASQLIAFDTILDANGKKKEVTYPLIHLYDNDYTIKNYQVWTKGELSATLDVSGEFDYLMQLNRVYPMFYVYKCSLQEGYAHLYSPIISRLAEMYLNAAEAHIKNGKLDLALPYLNAVRFRATGSEYSLAELQAKPKQIITEERQLEFAYEAHRTQDVFRNGETMERRYPGPHAPLIDYPATSSRVVQLIPQSEILAYPSVLTQNPIE